MTLKELREKKQITLSQLAATVGYSEDTVVSWENGSAAPSLSEAYMLSQALEASMEDIFLCINAGGSDSASAEAPLYYIEINLMPGGGSIGNFKYVEIAAQIFSDKQSVGADFVREAIAPLQRVIAEMLATSPRDIFMQPLNEKEQYACFPKGELKKALIDRKHKGDTIKYAALYQKRDSLLTHIFLLDIGEKYMLRFLIEHGSVSYHELTLDMLGVDTGTLTEALKELCAACGSEIQENEGELLYYQDNFTADGEPMRIWYVNKKWK